MHGRHPVTRTQLADDGYYQDALRMVKSTPNRKYCIAGQSGLKATLLTLETLSGGRELADPLQP